MSATTATYFLSCMEIYDTLRDFQTLLCFICTLQGKKMLDNVVETGSQQRVNEALNSTPFRQSQTFFRPNTNNRVRPYYGFRSERDAGIALNAIGGYLIGSYFSITPVSFFCGLILTIMLTDYISDHLNLSVNGYNVAFGSLVLAEGIYFESEAFIGMSMAILMYCLLNELGSLDETSPELSPALM